ncbi:MAG TPA: FAD-binding oxidoreductase [Ignavibacteriaceae bacterium]
MEEHIVIVLKAEFITHDVKRLRVEKPEGYSFTPGQATEAAVNKPGLEKQNRPFTFTSLNEDPQLEFTIKTYVERNQVTKAIGELKAGDEVIIHDVWGAIHYNGPGIFFAAGAGVTPFIAIFRKLYKDNKISGNKLYFSNKTEKDIILKDEFEKILGENFYNTITREKSSKYDNRRIDEGFIKEKVKDFGQNFYVCGPDKFVTDLNQILQKLGANPDSVIIEK